MLLETLEKNKNNLIIFSQNIFDFEGNFKILHKDVSDKRIEKLSYTEVCKFIDLDIPKNLLVYRLLTNIKKFEILFPKYGYYVLIQNSPELVYFDPVFAVKELENFDEELDLEKLRFRIQQVGLTKFDKKNKLPVYRELYAIDLKAKEAQNQNDSVFVEAYLSKLMLNKRTPKSKTKDVDTKAQGEQKSITKESKTSEAKFESFEERLKLISARAAELEKLKLNKEKNGSKTNIEVHQIEEDKKFDSNKIVKMSVSNLLDAKPRFFTIKENEKILKNTLEQNSTQDSSKQDKIAISEFSKFLKSKRELNKINPIFKESEKENDSQVMEVFKSNPPAENRLRTKRDEKFVLRIKD